MLIVQNAAEPARLRYALVDMIAAGAVDIRAASAYVTLGGANILLSAVENAVGTPERHCMQAIGVVSARPRDRGVRSRNAIRVGA
ncbi:hypothetical protein [Paracoccus sp. MKU1]|uniref:hypothetical protein n=1 Tax=Paracoccus sp. MKU1 TaxID=1745182 RepID=UPI000B2322C5|nr:hypothetical protein [Paracoccus sp. MKU1]